MVSLLLLLPLGMLYLVPSVQAANRALAAYASFIPYFPIPLATAGLGLLMALSGRIKVVGLVIVVLAVGIATTPWWREPTAETPRPPGSALKVLSLNTEFGQADPAQVIHEAASADVIALQEFTPEMLQTLEDDGLSTDFPYRAGTTGWESYGTMIWSRTPLTLLAQGRTRYESLVIRTEVRGTAWTVATLHAISPKDGVNVWTKDAAAVVEMLSPYVSEHLVVVGDFNAVDQHLTMRRIRAIGLKDSMEGWPLTPGDGWQLSWPHDHRLPFLIRIDHALHSASVEAWRPQYLTFDGTDHRGLLATFAAV